ncbi:MAG TPA: hypothetical protein VFX50_08070, partial [Gemmatimonadales bacterium]|nr:hypothetical protein [Gemmatimonadales bacterium]
LFREVEDVELGAVSAAGAARPRPSALVRFTPGTRAADRRRVLAQMEAFLQARTGSDSVRVAAR